MDFFHKYKHLLISVVLPVCIMCSTFQPYSSFAQPYTFSLDTATYTDLSTPTSLNNDSTWDDPEYHISIGFTFDFFDRSFDSIHISDHSDYMWFDDNKDYRIDAFSTDFIDRAYPDSSVSPISYKLTGAAGSYILKIEWKNAGFYGEQSGLGTTDDFVNIQLWLYEGTNNIEIHIGAVSVQNPVYSYEVNGGGGAVVGLSNTMLNEFIYLTDSANNPIPVDTSGFNYLIETPLQETIYRFSKNVSGIYLGSALNNKLIIYPNPTPDVLNVSFGNPSTNREILEFKSTHMIIMDLAGRIVYEREIAGLNGLPNLVFDLSEFKSGVYFIQLKTDKVIYYGKMIKQ